MADRALFVGLAALLVSGAVLWGATGVLGTLISLRADAAGLSSLAIGALGSAFFAGFVVGTYLGPKLVSRVGHIRAFAVYAAAMAAFTLGFALVIDGWAWAVARFGTGVAVAGLSLVVESWINEKAGPLDRGRILSVYRVLDLSAVTACQYLLAVYDPNGFEIFSVIAIIYCLALMPVTMTTSPSPKPIQAGRLDLKALYVLSPLAVLSVFSAGLVNAAFRHMGPLYAQAQGFDSSQIATFVAMGVVGGAVLQFPFGWASDRIGRRAALVTATLGAITAGLSMVFLVETAFEIYAASFLFGGFVLPIYSLAIAHANDFAEEGRFVEVAAGLLLVFGLGAVAGPFLSALAFDAFGPRGLFVFACAVHFALLGFTAWRAWIGRRSVRRGRFVALIRTSPRLFDLDPRSRDQRDKS